MIVIEDKGKISFFCDGNKISKEEGFNRLENLYENESIETKKIIDRLKEKYIFKREV